MKFKHSTESMPAELTFGKILNVELYKHMICWMWFQHLELEFAWWAWGVDFTLFEVTLLKQAESGIVLFSVQVGKTSIDLIHYFENQLEGEEA